MATLHQACGKGAPSQRDAMQAMVTNLEAAVAQDISLLEATESFLKRDGLLGPRQHDNGNSTCSRRQDCLVRSRCACT